MDVGLYVKDALEAGEKVDFEHHSWEQLERNFLEVREKSGAARGKTFIKGMTQFEINNA